MAWYSILIVVANIAAMNFKTYSNFMAWKAVWAAKETAGIMRWLKVSLHL
jgi:hypothetical protein